MRSSRAALSGSLALLADAGHMVTDAVGIGLVSAGILLIALGRKVDRQGLAYALLTGVSIAAYTVIDANGVRAAPTPRSARWPR